MNNLYNDILLELLKINLKGHRDTSSLKLCTREVLLATDVIYNEIQLHTQVQTNNTEDDKSHLF